MGRRHQGGRKIAVVLASERPQARQGGEYEFAPLPFPGGLVAAPRWVAWRRRADGWVAEFSGDDFDEVDRHGELTLEIGDSVEAHEERNGRPRWPRAK